MYLFMMLVQVFHGHTPSTSVYRIVPGQITPAISGDTGSYSDTPYSDSSYSDNSYSAAKVFTQVMFVTVTVPLGVTLYASCVGHFSMFTSAQLRLSVTHCCSTVPVL